MIQEIPFDTSNELEAAVLDTLQSEGVLLARHEYAWSGEDPQRLLFGVVAGEDGPEAFLAAVWKSWGTNMNVRIHMRLPVEVLCARFLPGTGEHAAQQLIAHDGYDSAAAAVAGGPAVQVGRTADTSRAALVLRIEHPEGKRVAMALCARNTNGYSAELSFEAPMSELAEWARREFARAPSHRV